MALIRVPYPEDPADREALFHRAAALLARHGAYEGGPDAGTFHGRTPVGRFAGSYRSPAGSGVLEIHLTKKPLLVPAAVVERELRRLLAFVGGPQYADRHAG
jgi:hypothetical protein